MELLDGRVAVVTGAGRGIGRGIALELAREGAKVVVNDAGVETDGAPGTPHMREKEYGRIVSITSSAGLRGNFGQTNYAAAKAGIVGMTLTCALELGKCGIAANAMAPSAFTRMTTGLLPGADDPSKIPRT